MLGHFLNFDILRLWEEGLREYYRQKDGVFYKETQKIVEVLSSGKKKKKKARNFLWNSDTSLFWIWILEGWDSFYLINSVSV